MKWLFLHEVGRGWRWELRDDSDEAIAYEDGFKTAADAARHAAQHGYAPADRDWAPSSSDE